MHPEILQLFDPKSLASAETLGLNARFIVEGYMAGEHRSPYHGFSVEFAQHREYAPGDDVRHLDWKALGKTDRHYIKQYEQDTNYVAHLLLDGSESMCYASGDVSKWQYAKMMAACLGYLILKQRDAVALGIFQEDMHVYLPRSDSRNQLVKLMTSLAAAVPGGRTALGKVLDDLAQEHQRRGIVLVMSDFLDENDDALVRGIEHLRFQGHEVIAFHVLDPFEIEFPIDGLVEFVGLENLPSQKTRPAEIRASYLQELKRHVAWLQDLLIRHRCHYVQVNTAHALDEVLSGYFVARREASR